MEKSKICIVSSANLKHMTLVSLYTKILDEKNINYDLIYYDRYGIEEETNATNIYKYTQKIDKRFPKLHKLFVFLKFKNYARKLIETKQYDFIIVWNTLTSLLLLPTLLKNKKKYILNIRDYYFEKNKIIYYMHGKLIKDSLFSTISSKGFKEFLPNYNYVYVHSLNKEIEPIIQLKKSSVDNKIVIGFLGNIRFYEEQKKVINAFKNDDRFLLWYSGTNFELLKDYVMVNRINNVVFTGPFNPKQTNEILSKFNIINNIFGNDSISVKTLTSIRLYYAAIFKIPIIVNENTFMGKLIDKYKIGLTIDSNNPNLADEIFKWYTTINYDDFYNSSKVFHNKVLNDNKQFEELFSKVVNKLEGS